MSWLARSIANSLLPPDDADEEDDRSPNSPPARSHEYSEILRTGGEEETPTDPDSPTRGVKEDLSELKKTLTRQFWGVASFLAPPPTQTATSSSASDDTSSPYDRRVDVEASDSPATGGIRSDFAEIGGKFRTGISKLSSHKAVSEISKIASTFLPFGSEEEEEEEVGEEQIYRKTPGYNDGAIGVTDEVLTFARNISMHPETWLDFPLLPDEEDSDDFDMSDAQQEHALAVERLAPRLAALRIELCPSHMSEGCFWKIYFVLLHPRLNKQDAELLSTPQIVEAREMLQRLQNRRKLDTQGATVDLSYRKADDIVAPSEKQGTASKDIYDTSPSKSQEVLTTIPITDFETEKHPVLATESQIVDKAVIEEELLVQPSKDPGHASGINVEKFDEDGDDWLEEETCGPGSTAVHIGDEEDVSFSDLEEDDDKK
ncbi:uncharacterized protein [Typha angustifolia]|uniref:uncharacterized protein n=1 Tax=Typha angustifolia TaxID=59011 RepID=UPI003C2DC1B4